MKRSFSPYWLLLPVVSMVAVILHPVRAAAHLVTTGMGPVYDGIGHLLLTPEDLIIALALALYGGLLGTTHGRHALFLVPAAWFVGGLFGMQTAPLPDFPVAALSFLLLGLLIAADLRLPPSAFTITAVAVSLTHGFFNGIALKNGPAGLGLVGIMAALFILVTLVSALVVSLRPPWSRIAVRVMGSWVAAVGVLMIGWFVRGNMA